MEYIISRQFKTEYHNRKVDRYLEHIDQPFPILLKQHCAIVRREIMKRKFEQLQLFIFDICNEDQCVSIVEPNNCWTPVFLGTATFISSVRPIRPFRIWMTQVTNIRKFTVSRFVMRRNSETQITNDH